MPSKKIGPGSEVEIQTTSRKLKGILLDSHQKGVTVVKLSSGYNLGIKSSKIKHWKVLKAPEKKGGERKPKSVSKKNDLPEITILHTGGTIASKVDYRTGGTYAGFSPDDILALFPELGSIASVRSELFRNMWSDDLRVSHFTLLAKRIESEIKKGVQGIIISMGTDNLAVCAAALSFIVRKSPIPIILVGAQRSSDRPSSDASLNLISAAYFIAQTDFAGIAICMHHAESDEWCAILPPAKTRKLHTSKRSAFKAVGCEPIALVSLSEGVKFSSPDYLKRDAGRKPVIRPEMEEKVGLIKVSINMFAQQFQVFKGFKGLVIEGTGLGHTPGDCIDNLTKEHPKIISAIKSLADKGTVIVMTSSCINGSVSMNVYSKGRDLLAAGVIPGADMLSETALVKLSWLLANFSREEAKMKIQENLVGEIQERLLP